MLAGDQIHMRSRCLKLRSDGPYRNNKSLILKSKTTAKSEQQSKKSKRLWKLKSEPLLRSL